MRTGFAAITAAAVVIVATSAVQGASAERPTSAPQPRLLLTRSVDTVPGAFVVTLAGRATAASGLTDTVSALVAEHGGHRGFVYTSVLPGFSVRGLSDAAAEELSRDPRVVRVESDRIVRAAGTQSTQSYGLDRVDQRNLPVNGTYTWGPDGTGVRIYSVDSGVQTANADFRNSNGTTRASFGFDALGGDGQDCFGHGTHTSSVAAGNTYGVAKKAAVVAVRVLDCNGTGSTSNIIAGLDWVAKNAVKPAVANLSFGGTIGKNDSEDAAVRALISSGVTVVAAAGNGIISGLIGDDACNYSPSRVTEAIVVSSTRQDDARPSYANYGECVDIFAPGVDIDAATIKDSNDNASTSSHATTSGTSEAAPFVTGAAAMYLLLNPGATPAQVSGALTFNATTGVVGSAGSGSPNRLLYTGFMSSTPTPPAPATPSPTPSANPAPTPAPSLTPEPTPSSYPRPYLQQSSRDGQVTLQTSVLARYNGKKVTFYVRSGQTGQVRPLGQATVAASSDGYGYAVRNLKLTPGQALRVYSKIEAVTDMTTPYSNDVDFRVK